MLKKFIERPVLSTVISIIIFILGILGLTTLPITQYPDIAPPTVQVTASYPGANAETLLESVIIPIEEKVNGVEGMTYMTSSASNDGSATITVYFKQSEDPDIAAVNVQNRVAQASSVLPAEVTRAGVITQKTQNSALMYTALFSTNPDYDDTFVQNYFNINVKPELERIDGVGQVNVFGGRDYSMRISIDPDKMATYGLTSNDVIAAINEQSLEAAAGSLGQNSGESFEYVIKYKGRYKTSEEYGDIIIKALDNGKTLRIKDVASVNLDAFSYSMISRTKGNPAINFGVFQIPGSNAQEINAALEQKLEDLKKNFPEGIDYVINYNTNKFLDASIDKVTHTLFEAFILVFIVVFIFLQDIKSTIIPAIAVPVAIVGTFFFLNVAGFSINLLTLFALILAIGIVVDDAIVVVEAVHTKLEEGYDSARKAAISAMSEISGAIISITLVMAAVFVPITFIQGPSGVFYQQFGITLIVAILISAVNALTLSPALCAVFLKPHKDHPDAKKNFLQRFYAGFNTAFNALIARYTKTLGFMTRHKWVTAVILVVATLGIFWANRTMPTGFVPQEDRGVIFVNIELPPGASLDRTYALTSELYDKIHDIEGIRSVSFINGRNFFSGNGSSYSLGFILLEDWDERDTDATSIDGIVGQLFQRSAAIADANIVFFTPPSISGFGLTDIEMQLLDRSAGSYEEFNQVAQQFVGALNQSPEVAFASNSFNINFPQWQMDINVPKAKEAGVAISDIFSTMQGYIGGYYAADFSRFGKQYRVFVQASPQDRKDRGSLNSIYVRNANGEMAPISEFVTLSRVYGPQTVSRFNLFNNTTINGASAPGYSTGNVIAAVNKLAEETLPGNFEVAYSGITREEIASSGQAGIIFALSIVFVYFFLAAQYESYILPFSVLLSLPVGIAGAYITTKFAGLENNIYFQIALVMLIGLLAKNAILIVEFAIQRRRHGMSLIEAAIDAGRVRLRPILMTSFAFIVGLMPLVLAKGVGAVGNNSIGTGAAFGMLIGTLIGLFIIPTLFVVFQWLQERISGVPEAVKAQEETKES